MTASPVVILNLDFDGQGGIERFSRELITALSTTESFAPVGLAPYGDPDCSDPNIVKLNVARGRALRFSQKMRFLWLSYAEIRKHRPICIIATHVSLGPWARFLARRRNIPYAIVCHGIEVWITLPRIQHHALTRADRIWSVSRYTATQVQALHRVEPSLIELIPLPVSGVFSGQEQAASPESSVVLTVARLSQRNAYKGVDKLIDAWPGIRALVPEAQLVIVGDGDFRHELQSRAIGTGEAASIRFTGSISDEALLLEYREAAVFALPGRASTSATSPEGEGFGIVFIEAAMMGLPSVAGNSAGAAEAVAHEETGLLVDATSQAAIVASLTRLLLHPDERARLGQAARSRALERYSPRAFAVAISALLADLTK